MTKTLIFLLISLAYCAEKANVYMTKIISAERMVDMLKILNVELKGNIALKVHSGEPNGPYFLRPSFLQKIYDYTGGTFIEGNVAYTIQAKDSTLRLIKKFYELMDGMIMTEE